jgi:hypothetical protein
VLYVQVSSFSIATKCFYFESWCYLLASLNKLYSEHLNWKKLEIYADCLGVFKFQSLAFFCHCQGFPWNWNLIIGEKIKLI